MFSVCFLRFFNVVFLLFLKHKCTKLQILCMYHGQRLHFLDRANVLQQYYGLSFVLTILLT